MAIIIFYFHIKFIQSLCLSLWFPICGVMPGIYRHPAYSKSIKSTLTNMLTFQYLYMPECYPLMRSYFSVSMWFLCTSCNYFYIQHGYMSTLLPHILFDMWLKKTLILTFLFIEIKFVMYSTYVIPEPFLLITFILTLITLV